VDRRPLERLAAGVFVGREPILALLEGGLERALAGTPAWLLLRGEAGAGKTRTAEALGARAAARGFAVHLGRCPETEGAPPYRPWLQVLRSIRDELPPAERGALAATRGRDAGPLATLLPELGTRDWSAAGDGPEARFQLFEAVASLLRAAARRRPRLLLFDDVQGADEASLALLAFCARELAGVPIAVLATRRDPAPYGASDAVRAALARAFEEVPLSRFGDADLRAFFRALTDREPSDAFVAAVRERTEGTPLFVTELARLLALEGRLDPADAGALAGAPLLPSGAREVLRQRVAGLSPDCRRALACAAVIGRDVRRDLLERALDEPLAAALGPLLDEALAARVLLVVANGADAFRFAHVRIRDVLYEELPLDERARLHARVARALDALHPLDPAPVVAELAHHARAASAVLGAAPAAHWAALAGRDAARRLAFGDARAWLESALDLLAQVSPADDAAARERDRRACESRLELARVCERAGDAAAAHAAWRAALESARRRGDAERFARAVLGLAGERSGTAVHAPDRERVALLEEALAAVPPARADLRVPLLGRLAMELHWSPERERRDALAHESIALARAAGDPTQIAQALAGAVWATWSPDDPFWRRDAADEILAREASCADPVPVLGAYVARAVARLELGDALGFDADVEAGGRLAAELRLGLWEIFFRSLRGLRAILGGRLAEGERLANESLAQARTVDSPHTPGVVASHLLLVRVEEGRAAELEPAFAAAAARARAPVVRASHAWLLVQLGRRAEARRALRGVLARGLDALPRDFFWLGAVSLLGEVAAAVEERRAARVLYEALRPYAGRVVVVGMSAGCLGAASRPLALLAAALGRDDEAEAHFEAALEENARLGALPFLARTSDQYAAFLHARARPGDVERAEKLEDEACALRAELSLAEARARDGGAAAGAAGARDPRARVEAQAPDAAAAAAAAEAVEATLERVAGGWSVRFGGVEARLRDARGLRYLARLLAEPERERHVLELAGGEGGGPDAPAERVQGLDVVADRRALAEYRARLGALRAELDEATAARDPGRAERARAELEAIERALAGAFGLSGRARRLGDPAERARKAVYNRLRGAIAAIESELPALGRHLARSVRTGTYCAYRPDRAIRWRVTPDRARPAEPSP